jgi:hypothetical protein
MAASSLVNGFSGLGCENLGGGEFYAACLTVILSLRTVGIILLQLSPQLCVSPQG